MYIRKNRAIVAFNDLIDNRPNYLGVHFKLSGIHAKYL